MFKPLWSPFLEAGAEQEVVVVVFQFIGAAALGLVALALHLPAWFVAGVAVLALVVDRVGDARHRVPTACTSRA